MASYLITGAARGIGFEFLRQLSVDPNNTVVGLVRDKTATEKRVAEELNRSNVHIVQADLTNYDALVATVGEVTKITGGSLDYIIANAANLGLWSGFSSIGALGAQHARLEEELLETFKTNVIGNIRLFNLYLPLVRKGQVKKVVTISTGMADNELIKNYALDAGGPYSISKAAMNTAVAKFDAEYAKDGILFMAICPGTVDTGNFNFNELSEEQQKVMGGMFAKFKEYAPHFTGPSTPEAAVKDVMAVVDKASLADGYGGSFLSHLGTKKWL